MYGNWDWTEKAVCPHSFSCPSDKASFDIGRVPSYISITSSSLSCLGSILIVITYFALKDMRTGAQKVITLLAIADFFTAFGYIIGSSNFLIHFVESDVTDIDEQKECIAFTYICEIQSFITTWSTMCSYCWTCILAFYFFLVLVFRKKHLAARLIPLYNVIAWLGPLVIMLPLLITGKLGFAPYVASNWCYIKDMDYNTPLSQKPLTIVYLLVAGKLWEVMCYVVILVLYLWIRISMSRSHSTLLSVTTPNVERVEKRLLAIPLLYIFLRMWGTLQFFYSLGVANTNHDGCIPHAVKTIYLVFGILQAVGDSGQGWGNAILYIFLSPIIRKRMFVVPCNKCLNMAEDKLQNLLESDSADRKESIIQSFEPTYSSTGNTSPRNSPMEAKAAGYRIKKYEDSTTAGVSTSYGQSRSFKT